MPEYRVKARQARGFWRAGTFFPGNESKEINSEDYTEEQLAAILGESMLVVEEVPEPKAKEEPPEPKKPEKSSSKKKSEKK